MWKVILSALLTAGLIWVLDTPLNMGQTRLPAIGKFMSPSNGFWRNAEGAVKDHVNIELDGVKENIRVVFDERLVPHIFANSKHDLFYAQGYVTAMHRLWQMDFSTRAAAGRISEIVGMRALGYDKRQRMTGLAYGAENAIKGWKKFPEEYALLESYTAGVNAYIDQLDPANYPLEYKLIGFSPEPWTPYKSALFTKSMAQRLCRGDFDLEHSTLLKWLGLDKYKSWFPDLNPHDDPIIPPGTDWEFEPVPLSNVSDTVLTDPMIGARLTPIRDIQPGSNNWAVAGSKTASGAPILCNDPHLGLTLPSVWYEIHLNAPDYNCYGVSLPGLPGAIIGFNDNIAWGMTNVNVDVADWYLIQWVDSTKTAYIVDGQPRDAKMKIERYVVLGEEAVLDTVRYTIWGPAWEEGAYANMALRWLAHDESNSSEVGVFMGLNQARNIEDYLAALDKFHTPAQNFAYADRKGNIALRVGGRWPLRTNGQGRFVQDGSRSENAWHGLIPSRHNPVVINPERGFVSSANQKSTDNSYPYYYHAGTRYESYRGRILNEKLARMDKITVEDMSSLQYDSESLKAREILPDLLGALNGQELSSLEQAIRDTLENWDFVYRAESVSPMYWERWYMAFYNLVWDEFDQLADSVIVIRPESWRTIDLAKSDPDSEAFDLDSTELVEDFTTIARISFKQAGQEISELGAQRSWGNYRQLRIGHLANIDPLSVTVPNAPGHGDALNATGRTGGPSWRMIVHLTDPVEAYVIYPGGQSGNPGSPYYDDMITDWTAGRHNKVHFVDNPDDIEAHRSMLLQKAIR